MAIDANDDLNIAIEPFDPTKHDRTAFSCGMAQIDNFLRLSAKKQQKGGFTRIWVALIPGRTEVIGYYAINSHGIEGEDLPKALMKNTPNHGYMPAAYISTIGVTADFQGRGLGQVLLADALKRVAALSDQIGITVVVLDVLQDGDDEATEKRRRFYERFGFIPFTSRPLRMYLPIKTVREVMR